jgi:hypothetical protein
MLDITSITGAMLAAAVVAGGLVLVMSLATRHLRAACAAVVIGVAMGSALGWWWIQALPHWPAATGLDRLLVFVLPAAALIEAIACLPIPCGFAHGLRLAACAATPPVLLEGTRYVTDWAGPATRDWTFADALAACAGLSGLLALAWLGMTELASRAPRRSYLLALAMACAVSGPVLLLSSYKTAGEMAFPLTTALLGAALATLFLPAGAKTLGGALGVGLAALYGILFLGVFFARLHALHAVLLLAAPLACWVLELPRLRDWDPWYRSAARVALVLLPLAFVFWRVWPKSEADAAKPSRSPYERFQRGP